MENGNRLAYNTKVKDILPDWHMVDPYMENHLDVLDLLCRLKCFYLCPQRANSQPCAVECLGMMVHTGM